MSSATLLYLLLAPSAFSNALLPAKTTFTGFAAVNAIATYAARLHIQGYWARKAKVPFVKRYNEAIGTTNMVRVLLGYATWMWVGVGIAGVAVGR